MKFEIFQSEKDHKFYFRLKAKNGRIILSSQGYASKQGCQHGIHSVKRNGKDKVRYIIHTSSNGRYYYNLRARNGQIIGKSQTYSSAVACENGIQTLLEKIETANIVFLF
ncbi:MAG: YegP family protein [Bacteroidota bacterium]